MKKPVRHLIVNYNPECYHQEGLTACEIESAQERIRDAQAHLKEGRSLSPELEEWCELFYQQYLAFGRSSSRSSRPTKRVADPTPASKKAGEPPSKKRASGPAPAAHDTPDRASELCALKNLLQAVRDEDLKDCSVSRADLSRIQKEIAERGEHDRLSLETTGAIVKLNRHMDVTACNFLDFVNPFSVRPAGPPTEDVLPDLKNIRHFLSDMKRMAKGAGTCGKHLHKVIDVLHNWEDKKILISPIELTADHEAKLASLLSTCSAQFGSAPSPLIDERLRFYVYRNPGLLDALMTVITSSTKSTALGAPAAAMHSSGSL